MDENLRVALRAVLAAVPGAGGPLTVLLEAAFPDPRLLKVEDWLAQVAGEVGRLKIAEAELRARLEASETARTILIEAFAASQRTTSTIQRQRLATLLLMGLSVREAAELDVLKLLRLFAALDEAELVVLTALGLAPEHRSQFENKHRVAFDCPVLSMASTAEDLDLRAMHDMRVRNLISLGLVKRRPPISLKDDEMITWTQVRITRPGLALVRLTFDRTDQVLEDTAQA